MGILIDTNVLEHADNPNEIRYKDSIRLIEYVKENKHLILYVDESLDKNNSYILSEYDNRIKPGMYGYTMLLLLIRDERLFPITRTIKKKDVNRKIKQWVHKVVDVAFTKVAYNSPEKMLISHDYTDFKKEGRKFLHDKIGVIVIEAEEYNKAV